MNIWIDSKNAIFQNSGISQWLKSILLGIADEDKNQFTLVSPGENRLPFPELNYSRQLLPWPTFLPRRVSALIYDLFMFRTQAHLKKPDLIFSPYFDVLMPRKIKSVITIHDLCFIEAAEQYSFLRKTYFVNLMKINLKRSSLIFTVSESSKKAIESFLGVPSKKIVVLANELDIDFKSYKPTRDEISNFRNSHQRGTKLVLYTGGLENRKNIPRLLSALDELNSEDQKVQLLISGSPHKRWLEIIGQKRLASSQVSFLGFLKPTDLKIAYSAVDAVIYPSLSEGFGRACIEAINSGAPLLCSDLPVFREVSGDYAAYFDPKNILSIKSALENIVNSEQTSSKAKNEFKEIDYANLFRSSIEFLVGKSK
jgi:glycosyltransferase involved in cell wall biosynthesis